MQLCVRAHRQTRWYARISCACGWGVVPDACFMLHKGLKGRVHCYRRVLQVRFRAEACLGELMLAIVLLLGRRGLRINLICRRMKRRDAVCGDLG